MAALPPGFDAGLTMTGMMGYGAAAFPFGTATVTTTTDPQQGGSAGSTQDAGTQGTGAAGSGSGSGSSTGQQTNLLQGIMRDTSGNVGGGGGEIQKEE